MFLSPAKIKVHVLPLAAVSAFVSWICSPLLSGRGLPFATDINGYLARLWYLANQVKEQGNIPEWFPFWYNGTTLLQYYPPLSSFLALPIQLITNDVTRTFGIFALLSLLASAYVVYGLASRWSTPPWAGLAAFLFVAAPFNVRTIFNEGNLPRTLEMALIPAVVWALFLVLEKPGRKNIAALGTLTLLMVLAHHQQAGITLIGLVPLVLVYSTSSADRRAKLAVIFSTFVVGMLLSGWWLLPAISHWDYSTVPDISFLPERLHLYSTTPSMLAPWLRSTSVEIVYFGLALVITGTVAGLVRRTRRNLALLSAGWLSLVLSFGQNLFFWDWLPANGIFPERFLHLPALMFALLAVEFRVVLIDRGGKAFLRGLAAAALLVWAIADFRPYWDFPQLSEYNDLYETLEELPPAQVGERIDSRGWAGGSATAFIPVMEQQRSLAFGWYIETTPHLPVIVHHNSALREDRPGFVLRNYDLWNVRTAMIDRVDQNLIDALIDSGFEEKLRDRNAIGLVSPEPSKPVMELGANTIVVGRGKFVATTALPWMSYAPTAVIDDLEEEYLSGFDIIVLFDFEYRNRGRLEERIRGWLSSGKQVVVDLTRMPDPELFGVRRVSVELPPEPEFEFTDPGLLAEAPLAAVDFGTLDNPWRSISYANLDDMLVSFTDDSQTIHPVIGTKDLEEGKIYYFGLNLFSHVVVSGDLQAEKFLSSFFEQRGGFTEITQPRVNVVDYTPPADSWGFTVELDQPTRLLVSGTWSPHWNATANGEPVPVLNHENLILLDLPAGRQEIAFSYGATAVQYLGIAITGIALILGALLVIKGPAFVGAYPELERKYQQVLLVWFRKQLAKE